IEISTHTIQCTCPSRKQPCKHGIALLLLACNEPSAVPETEQPEWINKWLAKRAGAIKRKETIQTKRAEGEGLGLEQIKAAEKRLALVKQGVEQLDLWLSDLIRNGLGTVGQQSDRFWQDEAAQMVDAQAAGLAARLRRMAAVPNASRNWPEHLLEQLGELALLIRAYKHLDQFEPGLQEEIRQMIGWTLQEADVSQIGEHVSDTWLFLGQQTDTLEHGYAQRTWLIGRTTMRTAMLSQFRPFQQEFARHYPLGCEARATLAYWPGVAPQRAFVEDMNSTTFLSTKKLITDTLPGEPDIATFLSRLATTLAVQPWRNRFLCVMRNTTIFYEQATSRWWLRDQQGQALPLAMTGNGYWTLLAISGGNPVDIAAEWNGETLTLLGMVAEHGYVNCQEEL
ncbi:MAG TPA: SWIM zinc finger family protein, partial [Ktedonobacteraceae bacterium]